jgi:hypothetical protein
LQGKSELGNNRVLHGSGRRVLHQGEGGKKHLPFDGDDVWESRDHGMTRVR